MTATRGFPDLACGEFLEVSCGFASGYHGLAALPKRGTRQETGPRNTDMSETRIREEICRLGRSLFERGLTPGSSGNIT